MRKYLPDDEIDQLCDEFEASLTNQENPSIELYLERVDQERQSILLYWILTVYLPFLRPDDCRIDETVNTLKSKYRHLRSVVSDAAEACGLKPNELPSIPGYRVDSLVSQGGQGAVYQAIQHRTGQKVAIKLVSMNQLDKVSQDHQHRLIARLEKEIRTTASLNHPNIVKIFDAGECEAGFYFVMQWISGGSLADHLPVSQTEATKIIRGIAGALAAAHEYGVLHLDVKPANILIDGVSKEPLLADFGLARLAQDASIDNPIAGTLGYMSPEQAMGARLDSRTDIYGLGATFYELLTSKKPYKHVSLPYTENQREQWVPTPPREIRRDTNTTLNHICMKCLAFDPNDRFSTCSELAAKLDQFSLTEDGRRVARISARTLWVSPLFLLLNLLVVIQIQLGWASQAVLEPLIWFTMFSMYLFVFFVLGSVSQFDKHSPEHLAIESLWAVWIAKFLAALTIAGSLRLVSPAKDAILMCYPMFSALTGFVLATMAPRYWRSMYAFAVIAWGSSLFLMWTIMQGHITAPGIYGGIATILTVIWGIKLQKLAGEQQSPATQENGSKTTEVVTTIS